MNKQQEAEYFHLGYWIIGLFLFIPINGLLGFGLLYYIDAALNQGLKWQFEHYSIRDFLTFSVMCIFLIFNIVYLIYTFINLKKYNDTWYLILPLLISFAEVAGCIPFYFSY